MQKHDLVQGSPEWLAHRSSHFNASDAPAMMGASPYKTRDALLLELHTGMGEEFSQETQLVLAEGHRAEALARPLAEQIIGEDLFPVVATNGKLSASFDGLTMLDDVNFEHKQMNARLRAAMVEGCTGADLPLDYQIQMEQQHMVSSAEKTLFMASKWDADGNLIEERHCWYHPNPDLAARIGAGWEQFEQDLCNYTPPERAAVIVAKAVTALPAVSVQVAGAITLTHNLAAFETTLRDFIDHRLIREPKTDQDFADLDLQIKAMKGAEEALESAESQMLAQISAVDAAKRTKDMLHKLVRDNRLMAEKLLASEKERRKAEIVREASEAFRSHIAALNERLGKAYMPAVPADFAGAIKGKKSIDSMQSALNQTLASAKIEASAIADKIQLNLNTLRDLAGEHKFLFADAWQIVLKQPDDLTALVKLRIKEHDEAEEKKREDARKQQRADEIQGRMDRLRGWPASMRQSNATSAAVAERMAQVRAIEIAEADFGDRVAEAETLRTSVLAALQTLHDSLATAGAEAAAPVAAPATAAVAPAPAPTVAAPPPAPVAGSVRYVSSAPAAQPTLTLGAICSLLDPVGGITITAAYLERRGFPAAGRNKSAYLYHESDMPAIRRAIAAHVLKTEPALEAA